MTSLTFGLFTQVSDSMSHGPLVKDKDGKLIKDFVLLDV